MECGVGEAIRLRAFFVTSKVGTAGLTATVDYTDESGNATTGESASEGAIDGEYYYVLTPDAPGLWFFVFKTATATVDQQHLPGVIVVRNNGVFTL
jgi:hypothetical protein